jgi:two-component sensor histidine kinase
MQLIVSLLNLSMHKIGDPEVRELLAGISRRLVSMALVYEEFYTAPDMGHIDFTLYLHQLVDGLYGDFPKFLWNIAVVAEPEAVFLNLDQAIPAGLMAEELLINALKFAYPGEAATGGIRIALRRVGLEVELSVRDEGVGLPEGFAPDMAESLGMILIHTLARQLRGKIEFRRGKGTEAILRFPIA